MTEKGNKYTVFSSLALGTGDYGYQSEFQLYYITTTTSEIFYSIHHVPFSPPFPPPSPWYDHIHIHVLSRSSHYHYHAIVIEIVIVIVVVIVVVIIVVTVDTVDIVDDQLK